MGYRLDAQYHHELVRLDDWLSRNRRLREMGTAAWARMLHSAFYLIHAAVATYTLYTHTPHANLVEVLFVPTALLLHKSFLHQTL